MLLTLPTYNLVKTDTQHTIYNFSGKKVKMQMKARKAWCKEEESRPSFPTT